MSHKTLQDWLESAYEEQADCPPPESWLEVELEPLSSQEIRRLDSHVESCPRCAVERELAQCFDSNEMDLSQNEIRDLVRKLDEQEPFPVVEFPQEASTHRPAWPVRLALAATVVLAVGLAFQLTRRQPPTLPDAPQIEATRSATMDLRRPIGDIEAAPEEMVWNNFEGADRYQLVLTGVDRSILWETSALDVRLAVPSEIQRKFFPGATYIWHVEAVDSDGIVVGRSASREFTIAPESGS
jgi:hypothetical protein